VGVTYRIGLTGGIGAGKTQVSDYFRNLGVPVIDADQIARDVVKPGTPALSQMIHRWGPEILLSDGSLNRRRLRDIIFSRDEEKAFIEVLLHPLIQSEIMRRANDVTEPYVILDIPLLIEAGYLPLVDRVLVVEAPLAARISRVVARDQTSPEATEAVIRAQVNPEKRLEVADDVLSNEGDLVMLQRSVEALHHQYLKIARKEA
jgi:dephospho-CoA kinase